MQFPPLTEHHNPPKGTPRYISFKAFGALRDSEKYYYDAEYREYRTRKVRDYNECDCCGHKEFAGWIEEKTPVGKPFRYIWTYRFLPYIAYATMLDTFNKSNVLAARILNRSPGKSKFEGLEP